MLVYHLLNYLKTQFSAQQGTCLFVVTVKEHARENCKAVNYWKKKNKRQQF